MIKVRFSAYSFLVHEEQSFHWVVVGVGGQRLDRNEIKTSLTFLLNLEL